MNECAVAHPVAARPTATGWRWFLAAGTLAAVGYYLVPVLGLPAWVQVGWYFVISASAGVALVVGVHRQRPRRRAPWYLLAGGQALYAIADLIFYLSRQVLGIDQYPYYDDLLYLLAYPMFAAGLLALVRARTPGWDLPSLIDSLILAITAGLLMWVYLVEPGRTPGESLPAQLVSTAYPAMDLLLIAVGLRLLLGTGARSTSHRLLYASMLLMLVADIGYGLQELTGEYLPGGILEAVWLASALALGATGLHPSAARLTELSRTATPDTSPGRLAVLCVAATAAPAVLLEGYVRGEPPHVLAVALACLALFPLTLARMATLVAVQRRIASTDALTGLWNRRYFSETVQTQVAAARRSGSPLGLLLLDIDHFKRVNDTYGHDGGDLVLREVGGLLAGGVRPGDVVARYGGEEFAVLLPGLATADSAALAERIRRTLSGTPIAVDPDTLLTVTASIGVVSLPDHATTADGLVTAADRSLYRAKAEGRNRVVAEPNPALLPG